MGFVDIHILGRNLNPWFKVAKRTGEILLRLVAHQLPRQLALARHAEYDRAAVPVQERAQRPTRLDALACRFLVLQTFALAASNQFVQFVKCHNTYL